MKEFETFEEAFTYCYEVDKPVKVCIKVGPNKIVKLFPSGRCEIIKDKTMEKIRAATSEIVEHCKKQSGCSVSCEYYIELIPGGHACVFAKRPTEWPEKYYLNQAVKLACDLADKG